MANLQLIGDDQDSLECDECGVTFSLSWNRNGYTERIEYCPFCGDEIDSVIEAEEET